MMGVCCHVSLNFSWVIVDVLFPQLRSVVSAVALFWDLKSARCKATCFKSVAVGCNVLTSPMVVPMCGMLQCVLLHVALG